MKLTIAALVSFLRPMTAMLILLPLLMIGWAAPAVALPVNPPRSPPLRNLETSKAVYEVSQHVSVRAVKMYF